MAIPVMILGESGSGKTTSLMNMPPEKTLMIQPLRKPLPFPYGRLGWKYLDPQNPQSGGNMVASPNWSDVWSFSMKSRRPVCVLDDFQYNMVDEFMNRSGEKSFDKFTEIGNHVYQLCKHIISLANDRRFYFLWHTQSDETGKLKAKTIGKLLDEKVTMEGMFTVVLMAAKNPVTNNHCFYTQSQGKDTVKSPIGMFAEPFIPNDLLLVDNKICDYYGIPKINQQTAA
ncbi:MAG: ATP-binding protein [Gammaproteobacteria bacterium]|nr:ATP-binding protein [Gammaproteobacteria bacterium]